MNVPPYKYINNPYRVTSVGQAKTVGRMSEKSGQHDKLVATLREQIAAKDAEAASVTGQLQGVQALLKKLKGQNKKTKNALLGIAREKTAHKSLARKIAKARDTLAQLRGELGKSTAAAEARYKAKARKLMLKRVDLMVQATQLTRACRTATPPRTTSSWPRSRARGTSGLRAAGGRGAEDYHNGVRVLDMTRK